MNRTIKFRGKDVITGNWAYGYYYISKGHHIIRDEKDNECIVLEKSVGQFIGLYDKNEKEIYEGNKISNTNKYHKGNTWTVEYKFGSFLMRFLEGENPPPNGFILAYDFNLDSYEIIEDAQ